MEKEEEKIKEENECADKNGMVEKDSKVEQKVVVEIESQVEKSVLKEKPAVVMTDPINIIHQRCPWTDKDQDKERLLKIQFGDEMTSYLKYL